MGHRVISLTYAAKYHITCFIIVKPGLFRKPRALARSQNDVFLPERSLRKAVSMRWMKTSADIQRTRGNLVVQAESIDETDETIDY